MRLIPQIWIVSYPRSGNTFFRNVLDEVYGIPSETYFLSDHGRSVNPDYAAYPAVKTHLLPQELPVDVLNKEAFKVVYLVRDGRDSVVSEAHHRRSFAEPDSDFEVNLFDAVLAPGGSHFGGGWSQHVETWLPHTDVVIRFEDLIADPLKEVARLGAILDLPTARTERLPTFDSLRQAKHPYGAKLVSALQKSSYADERTVAAANFRKGKVGSWREEMPEYLHDLFWMLHGDTMDRLAYGAGERPAFAKVSVEPAKVLLQVGNIQDPARDGTWRYTIELLNGLHELERKTEGKVVQYDLALKEDEILPLNGYKKESQNLYQYISQEQSPAGTRLRRRSEPEGVTPKLDGQEAFWRHRLEKWPRQIEQWLPTPLDWRFKYAWRGPFVQRLIMKWERRWHKHRVKREAGTVSWDLLHMMLPQFGPASDWFRGPWLITFHDLTHRLFAEYHTEGNIMMADRGMRLAEVRDAHFMAISEHSQADLEAHCRVPSERIHLALEGANWDLFKPERDDHRWSEVRDKLALPDAPFFLVLNTLEPRKNLKGTIEGFLRCLADCDEDLHLVVAGAVGWKHESLPADDHRKHPNIHFVGFVDDPDLPVLYSRALALCYLSFYEGFGLPPLEAMSCGAPVIGGDNSSLPEVIGNGGLLVNAQSHEAIAEAMTRVAHDEALRTVLSEKARKQAHRFSWTRMAWLTMRAHLRIARDKTNQVGGV